MKAYLCIILILHASTSIHAQWNITNSIGTALSDVSLESTSKAGHYPILYTGTENFSHGKYLILINSKTHTSASGLKVGGLLVADAYDFANPSKNDLIVKGKIAVGTNLTPGNHRLCVGGSVLTEEVNVMVKESWPDYVFEHEYKPLTLQEIEGYIKQNKHLPEVPSAKEIEANGMNLKEMNILLLKKVEELTLYLIEQKKDITSLKNQNISLTERLNKLENKD